MARIAHKEVTYTAPTATMTLYMTDNREVVLTGNGATKAEAIAAIHRDNISGDGLRFKKG